MSADTVALLRDNWRAFRTHRPAGEYGPVGQLDGDCAKCKTSWPCDVITQIVAEVDGSG